MRLRYLISATVAVALVATGCGVEGSGPTSLSITASDFAFAGVPETIRGGVVDLTFSNEGEVAHEVAFIDIGDTPFERFKEDFPAVLEGGPFPSYMTRGAVPFEIEPGETIDSSVTLPAGSYLLMCALTGATDDDEEGPPHYELGMVQNVEVEASEGTLPTLDGEIVARDYTFDIPALEAGTRQLSFRNAGPDQWHHLVAMEYPEGIDEAGAAEAFGAMLEAGEGPPPEGVPEPDEAGFTGVFSPGLGQTFELELKSGRTYLFACFLQDTDGGPPHAVAHQMFETFRVA